VGITFQLAPWSETRGKLERGELDLASMFYSASRERRAEFSVPHTLVYQAVFARNDSPPYRRLEDLKGRPVAVQDGDIMHDYALEHGLGESLTVTATPEDALSLLVKGRVDYVLGSHLQGLYWIKQKRWDTLHAVETHLIGTEYCYAMKKGNSSLREHFNEGLRQLKESGQYRTIYNEWLGVLETDFPWRQFAKAIISVLAAAALLAALAAGIIAVLRRQVLKRTAELKETNRALEESRLRAVSLVQDMSLAQVKLEQMLAESKQARRALLSVLDDEKRMAEERDRLKGQLQQAQKMEAVGRLAGGVAHDFNNLLMGIMGYAELCQEQLAPDHPIREFLDEIMSASQRSAEITRQLLAFASKQTIAPKVLDLNETVAGMLKLLRRLIGEDINLAWMPGANLRSVKLDPSQVDQILANLCVNARDSIAGVGKITLETGNIVIDADYAATHAEAVPGAYVFLAVSDNGCGMDKETLAQVFEPFFTTKGMGKGTGLGLATVYGIVKQNSGFVYAYSEPGKGSTFKICLPQVAPETAAATDGEQAQAPRGQGETVLLVEDEKALRFTCGRFMETLGYLVLAAETPGEALRIAAAHAGNIALLLTDVVMPGMDGRQLAQRLCKARPGLRVLFMSGYTSDVITQRGVLAEGVQFLSKPFSRETLALKVREVLEARERI
jgi:signal transduction histidine kinase/ActR/RegA family two-component response regulator